MLYPRRSEMIASASSQSLGTINSQYISTQRPSFASLKAEHRRAPTVGPHCPRRKREVNMRKLLVAAIIAALPIAGAFAQSSPAPANQSGPGVSPTAPSPTDPSSAAESGNTKGIPERGTMRTVPGTTGSGMVTPRSMDRDNTSMPGQGVNKDDVTPPSR